MKYYCRITVQTWVDGSGWQYSEDVYNNEAWESNEIQTPPETLSELEIEYSDDEIKEYEYDGCDDLYKMYMYKFSDDVTEDVRLLEDARIEDYVDDGLAELLWTWERWESTEINSIRCLG